jgi:hypothetical protein
MKKKRPGTRGGRRESIGETDPFERVTLPRPKPKPGGRLPSDIADAAEAALDDMLGRTDDVDDDDILDEEPRTQTRSPSHEDILRRDDDSGEILTAGPVATNRPSKMPHGDAPGARSSASSLRADASASSPPGLPLPAPPRTTSVQTLSRPSPHPHVAVRGSPPPSTGSMPTRPTPTGPPTPRPHLLSPTPVPPRTQSRPTVGETPSTRGDYTTAERDSSVDMTDPPTHSMIDETAPVPDELILDLQSAPVELPIEFDADVMAGATDQLPRPGMTSLQVAVFEESAHLGSLQSAILAAGHNISVGASGRDGIARVLEALEDELDVVVAALPGGEAIIDAALALEPRPIVIATFGCSVLDAVTRAQAAGADLAITHPHDVERIAPIMLAAARLHVEHRVARASRGAAAALEDIADGEPRSLLAPDVFQRVIDHEISRAKRYEYPLAVALFSVEVDPPEPPSFIRGILRARAGNAIMHAIRDIDMATQLDDERLLVLLPYTDLKAATSLARRVIAAVADGDPVVSAGRRFPPRVVGAVAGATPGQPISFAKLMKNATRALEQARRDGAELAVQP